MAFHDPKKIKMQVCPECVAGPGEPCRTKTGKRTKLHVLRVNRAKRQAAPGECPACGLELVVALGGAVYHSATSGLACAEARL